MSNKQENKKEPKKEANVAIDFSEAIARRRNNPPNSIEKILLALNDKSVICRGGERFRGMPQAGMISLLGKLKISPEMLMYMEQKKLLEPKTISGNRKNYPAVVISKTGEKVLAIMSYLTPALGEKQ